MVEIYQNEEHRKKVIERGDGYEYIGSYHCGETTIDGKYNKSLSYMRVKCPYCGSEYDIILNNFVGKKKSKCTKCCNSYKNSFAYYIQQELKEPLNKYWDWEKNNELGINPYCITYQSHKKVYIKCTETDYHGSYLVIPHNFYNNTRCPYCVNQKIHPKDSFGSLYPEKAKYWDNEKNKKSPYEISKRSSYEYWFMCEKCNKSFKRKLDNLNKVDTGVICKKCHSSQGETKILRWLDENNITYIHDESYFEDLTGVGNGLLRPDFILPNERVWIEYDGRQHDKHIKSWQTKEEFEIQQKNDEIKNKYAKKNGWNLIRVKEKDFDNIETILENLLLKLINKEEKYV